MVDDANGNASDENAQAGGQGGPHEGTPAPGTDTDADTTRDLSTISAESCTVSSDASVTLSDSVGTRARFVNGQKGVEITATESQIKVQGPPDVSLEQQPVETFPDDAFSNDGEWTVITSTGISYEGAAASATAATNAANELTAAKSGQGVVDKQYGDTTILKKTIVKGMPKTGGPSPLLVPWAIALVVGIAILRRS